MKRSTGGKPPWSGSRRFGRRRWRSLGPQLVAESREQYLRYALSIWETCVDAQGVHDARRSLQALDVLCVLFDEEW